MSKDNNIRMGNYTCEINSINKADFYDIELFFISIILQQIVVYLKENLLTKKLLSLVLSKMANKNTII
jgi:hypothetical protein